MRLADLVATSDAVAAVSGRLEKIERLADLFWRLSPDEIEIAVGVLTGLPRQGRLGVSGATIVGALRGGPGRRGNTRPRGRGRGARQLATLAREIEEHAKHVQEEVR